MGPVESSVTIQDSGFIYENDSGSSSIISEDGFINSETSSVLSEISEKTDVVHPLELFKKAVHKLQIKLDENHIEYNFEKITEEGVIQIRPAEGQKMRVLPCFLDIVGFINSFLKAEMKKIKSTNKNQFISDLKALYNYSVILFDQLYKFPVSSFQNCIITLFKLSFNIRYVKDSIFHYAIKYSRLFLNLDKLLKEINDPIISIVADDDILLLPVILCARSICKKDVKFIINIVPPNYSPKSVHKKFNTKMKNIANSEFNYSKLIGMYSSEEDQSKPVVGFLSSFDTLKMLNEVPKDKRYEIISKTKFIFSHFQSFSFIDKVLYSNIEEALSGTEGHPFAISIVTSTPNIRPLKEFKLDHSEFSFIDTKKFDVVPKVMEEGAGNKELVSLIESMANGKVKKGNVVVYKHGKLNQVEIMEDLMNIKGTDQPVNLFKIDGPKNFIYEKFVANQRRNGYQRKKKMPLIVLTVFIQDEYQKKLVKVAESSYHDPNAIKVFICSSMKEIQTSEPVVAVIDEGYVLQKLEDWKTEIIGFVEIPADDMLHQKRTSCLGVTIPGIDIYAKPSEVKSSESEETNISPQVLSYLSIKNDDNDFSIPPEIVNYNKSIESLTKSGTIDENKHLTDIGKDLSKFSDLKMFFAAAILNNALSNYGNDPHAIVAGEIIVSILRSTELIADRSAKLLCDCFDANSDVVTLTRAIFKIAENEELGGESGLHKKKYNIILNTLNDSIKTNFKEKNEEKINEITKEISGFLESRDICDFVNKLLKEIIKGNSEWISVRSFDLENANLNDGILSYQLKNEGGSITLGKRPGQQINCIPSKCIVFDISKSNNKLRANIVHKSWEDDNGLPKFISLKVPVSFNTVFASPLLHSYLSESIKTIFTTEIDNKTALINFIANNQSDEDKVKEAIDTIGQLLKYIPRSVLVHNKDPFCVVEICSGAGLRTTSLLHFFSQGSAKPPHPYHITKNTMKAALSMYREQLDSVQPLVRFAITGQGLSFKLGEDHDEANLTMPTVDPALGEVFCSSPSHMVLLVEDGLPLIPGEKELRWHGMEYTSDKLSVEDEIRGLMPGIIRLKQKSQLFTFNQHNESIKKSIEGYKGLIDSNNILRGEIPANSTIRVKRPNLNQLMKERNALFKKRNDLNDEFNKNKNNKEWRKREFNDFKQRQSECNSEIAAVNQKINACKMENDKGSAVNNVRNAIGNVIKTLKFEETQRGFFVATVSASKSQEELIIKMIKEGFSGAIIETIPLTDIWINHLSTSSLSKEDFVKKINDIANKFGFIKQYVSDYTNQNSDSVKGNVKLSFIDARFALAFATEFKNSITDQSLSSLRIPMTVIHPILLQQPLCLEALKKWFEKKNLKFKQEGTDIRGPRSDVQRAISLLLNYETRPKMPLAHIKLPAQTDFHALRNKIRALSWRSKCILLENSRSLIVPSENEEEARLILSEIAADSQISTICNNNCDEVTCGPTSEAVILFGKNGSVEKKPLCFDCTLEQLVDYTARFSDPVTGTDFVRLMENIIPVEDITYCDIFGRPNDFYPDVPLGMFLYALVQEKELSALAKTWVNGKVVAVLRSNPQLITFCPNHPLQPIAVPSSGCPRCKRCGMVFCDYCGQWHNESKCPRKEEEMKRENDKLSESFIWSHFKRCPHCRFPIEKISGCNHITCRCGKHWCFNCAKVYFDTASECYSHLNSVHGGYY